MAKAADAFRTISEVADDLNLPQHVLRFWETRFSQIKPMKRGGGRRYYRPEDVDILRGIKHLLYGEGYTIKGVQRIFKEQGVRYVADNWQDTANEEALASDDAVQTITHFDSQKSPVKGLVDKEKSQASRLPTMPQSLPVVPSDLPPVPVAHVDQSINEPAPAKLSPFPAAPEIPSPVAQIVTTPAQPAVFAKVVTPVASSPLLAAPFSVTHMVPDHLVNAITPGSSVIEASTLPVARQKTDELRLPMDILPERDKEGGFTKSFGRGLLEKITGADGADEAGSNQADKAGAFSRNDFERLQATLVDLLECKRLLDQIR